jgi:hypothetical protein
MYAVSYDHKLYFTSWTNVRPGLNYCRNFHSPTNVSTTLKSGLNLLYDSEQGGKGIIAHTVQFKQN